MATTISKHTQAYGQQILDIKNRVNTELKRRSGVGSVASYAHNFTDPASRGNKIKASQINDLIDQLGKINSQSVSAKTAGSTLYASDMITLDATLATYEGKNPGGWGNDTGCAASCTGFCYSSCTATCRSSCHAGCGEDCGGGCSGECTGCKDKCGDSCNMNCAIVCQGTCLGSCQGSCRDTPCLWNCGQACASGSPHS